jgi:hypothetical protein
MNDCWLTVDYPEWNIPPKTIQIDGSPDLA